MSTTSPNFGLILASTSDQVNVTSHIANNLSTLDSILSVAHTGTGQLKAGLTFTNPILNTPVFSGTLSGPTIVGTTGRFNTITATGGALTVNTFNIGTYSYPQTAGSTNQLLTVVTGNAVWVTPAGGTGAATNLSNLTAVSINTSLNTLTAGFVTVDRIIATSGALTGLTSFQATTGTFAGNVAVSGTLTANVINCTGGAITAGGITVGTYALPSTIGSTGQFLTVTSGPALAFGVVSTGIKLVQTITFSNTSLVQFTTLTSGANYFGVFAASATGGASTAISFFLNTNTAANYRVSYYGFPNGAANTGSGAGFLSGTVNSAAGVILSTAGGVAGRFDLVCLSGFSYNLNVQALDAITGFPTMLGYSTGTSLSSIDLGCNVNMRGQISLYQSLTS